MLMSKSKLLTHLFELQEESEVPFEIKTQWKGNKIIIEVEYD